MNTMTMLVQVQDLVMGQLTAKEVQPFDKADLEQDIYMCTLELLQSGETDTYSVACAVANEIRNRSVVRMAKQSAATSFESLVNECVNDALDAHMQRHAQIRDELDQILSTVLSPQEEFVIRLRFGIPTTEMQEHYRGPACSPLQSRSYSIREIANIGRSRPNWHYSTTDLIAIERAALKKLRDNDDIYVIRFC